MLLEDSQSRMMQNGLYFSVSARASLPPGLQAIADNVANRNAVRRRATGASFEMEMARRGTILDKAVKSAQRIYAAMNQSIEPP